MDDINGGIHKPTVRRHSLSTNLSVFMAAMDGGA